MAVTFKELKSVKQSPELRAAAGDGTPRPEFEILLLCAVTTLDPGRADRVRSLLRRDIDWSLLLRSAFTHGLMPILYRNLNDLCPAAVPRDVMEQLRNQFHENAYYNLFRTRELLRLLRLFEDDGIPMLPFKGPVLAAS
ncbi:MAG: nucleotidyltransferase family protein, partial [Pyrinomonadaceae bacterium]